MGGATGPRSPGERSPVCFVDAGACASGEAAGADDFLPVLIYVTIRAGPERLESNLQYIQRFRRAPRLSGEGAYFYTNLVSAASFVETITADSLSMDPEAFRVRMWEAGVPGAEPAGHVAPGADADGGVGGGGGGDGDAGGGEGHSSWWYGQPRHAAALCPLNPTQWFMPWLPHPGTGLASCM